MSNETPIVEQPNMFLDKNKEVVKTTNNTPYLIAIVSMLLIGVVAIATITIKRPEADNTVLIATVFAFIGPTTLSLLAFMKSQETHLSVNSRLDGFIKNAEAAAAARGNIEGQQIANERTDAIAKAKH